MSNLEIFKGSIERCESCDAEMLNDAIAFEHRKGCDSQETERSEGYFYWFCVPGYLPESDAFGPFKTEQDAYNNAVEVFGLEEQDDE